MQQAQQREVALLAVGKLNAPPKLRAHELGAADMAFGVAVTFLKRADERGQHFGVRGFMVKQFLRAHGCGGDADSLRHVGRVLVGHADGELHGAGEALPDLRHTAAHGGLSVVCKQRDKVSVLTADEVSLLGEGAAHRVGKQADLPVAVLVAGGAVYDAQTVDIADRDARRHGERAGISLDEHLKAMIVLKARQQVGFKRGVGEYEKLSERLRARIFELSHVAAERTFLAVEVNIALHGHLVVLVEIAGQVVTKQKVIQMRAALRAEVEQLLSAFVVQNEPVAVIEQHYALPQTFKNTCFQGVEHTVLCVFEAAPVQQTRNQAVPAYRVVKQRIYRFLRPEEKDRVHENDGQDTGDNEAVLCAVFLWDAEHLYIQQIQHRRDHSIREHEVHDVKRLHLIGVFCNLGGSRHIVDGNFVKRVDCKDNYLKRRVSAGCEHKPSAERGETAVYEIHRESYQQQKHHVDCREINARHDRHQQVMFGNDAYEVADVNDRGENT